MNQDTKAKIIIGGICGVVVLFIIFYSVSKFGDKKKDTREARASFSAPKLEEKKYDYNRKIDMLSEQKYVPKEETKTIETPVTEVNPFIVNEMAKQQEMTSESTNAVSQKVVNKTPKAYQQPKQPATKRRSVETLNNSNEITEEISEEEPKKRRKKRVLSSGNDTKTKAKKGGYPTSIPCKIYGDHRVTNNSKIRVRVTKNVTINSQPIKRNTILTGIAQLTNTKVNIKFETIQYENKAIPLNMKAYSRDGLQGIYIEGGIQNEIKKDAIDEAIEAGSRATNIIPIVGGVISSATKTQNKTVYVNIPNDYTIYLKK